MRKETSKKGKCTKKQCEGGYSGEGEVRKRQKNNEEDKKRGYGHKRKGKGDLRQMGE